MTIAAFWPANSLPQNSHARRSMTQGSIWRSTKLLWIDRRRPFVDAPRQSVPVVQAVVSRGSDRAAVRHATALKLEPDVEFLPQRARCPCPCPCPWSAVFVLSLVQCAALLTGSLLMPCQPEVCTSRPMAQTNHVRSRATATMALFFITQRPTRRLNLAFSRNSAFQAISVTASGSGPAW